MAEDRLKPWEILFQRALEIIDFSLAPNITEPQWSFGGGTVLMIRHGHRYSKDIDIFVPDPQYLAYITPKLSDRVAAMTTDYLEEHNSLKLRFAEGEIDFVASESLTDDPTVILKLFGRDVATETSGEIIAKKIWHRGDRITARDIFDLAMVLELEPEALHSIRPILRARRGEVLARIAAQEATLRESFDALDVLGYRRTFDECSTLVTQALER